MHLRKLMIKNVLGTKKRVASRKRTWNDHVTCYLQALFCFMVRTYKRLFSFFYFSANIVFSFSANDCKQEGVSHFSELDDISKSRQLMPWQCRITMRYDFLMFCSLVSFLFLYLGTMTEGNLDQYIFNFWCPLGSDAFKIEQAARRNSAVNKFLIPGQCVCSAQKQFS